MLGVVRDVTAEVEDRRRAEASAERLRHALEAAEASAWEWSPHAERGWWSHENFRLFGLDPDGGVPTFREWLARCVHADDRARLEADLTAALAGSDDVFALEYRIAHPDRGVRHITARGRCVRDPSGAVAKLVGLNVDNTERRSIEAALADSREQLDRRLAELEALYAEAPLGLGMLDRELRFVRINAALAEINGFTPEDHLGRCAWDLVPDLRASAEPVFERIFATGEARRDVPVHGTTPAQPGIEREWREHFYPIANHDGTVVGIGIVCEEVTAAKRAERQRELLIDELNHRVKNTLAVVHALAHQTFKPGADPEVARLTFVQRLHALGGAHELLTRAHWEAASLRALADGVVRRASPETTRVRLLGPEVTIPPKMAVTLAMTLNELCTNAVKYGALAVDDGEVELRWRPVGADAPGVALTWRETGGPPVTPPASKGFGLTMIEHALAKEFAADVQVDFVPQGLTCRITIPLASPIPAST
jgi:PAS domain S-box-containing protein